ncbi:hypothetical protein [Plantactinospora sp. GCM10030261]|uniref:hypothetical protein n=1 Tax=Plantactinospora sp. GCM10030261 TaxID=3273420 RepID=UPI003622903D
MRDVDWSRLEHAYGPAVDTPRHLAALLGHDRDAVEKALEHLDVAVLHQGVAYSATAPVVLVVAGYLDELAVEPAVRDSLLEFLGWVAEATVDIEHGQHGQHGRGLLPNLHKALVTTYQSVYAYVDAENADLRTTATAAAVSYARCTPLSEERPVLGALLRQRIAAGEKRAWYVAKLVALGAPVADYLDDPEFDVQVTAALAPGLADHPNATEILIRGLTHAAGTGTLPVLPANDPLQEYANSFIDPDPWRGYSLTELIAASTRRVRDFERIAEPAAQLVRTASWTGADRTWGPLVRAAFHPGYRTGAPLTVSQRLVLGALLDNPELWAPNDGNAALVFRQAGLPRDRDRCTQILNTTH